MGEVNAELRDQEGGQLRPEGQSLEVAEAGWLSRLKDRFNRVIPREEIQVERPQIDVNIYYSPHLTAKDLEELNEQYKACDIYIPEFPGWTPKQLERLRDVSDGKKNKIQSLGDGEAWDKILQMIYNTHKPIAVIDVPFDHQITEDLAKLEIYGVFLRGNFPFALKDIRGRLMEVEELDSEREKYMRFQLGPKIQELLKEYPLLKQKQSLKVLLSLGAIHTPLYLKLKEDYPTATRKFSTMPYAYNYTAEAIRRYRFAKEEDKERDEVIDDELAAKVFLESILHPVLDPLLKEKITKDSTKVYMFERKVVSRFNFEEANEIFDRLKLGEEPLELFKEKGMRIPGSEQELDEFLNNSTLPQPKSS